MKRYVKVGKTRARNRRAGVKMDSYDAYYEDLPHTPWFRHFDGSGLRRLDSACSTVKRLGQRILGGTWKIRRGIMSGTVTGGQRAAATTKRLYGEGFHKRVGAIGGRNGRTGGFYDSRPWWKKLFHPKNPHAQESGRKGGRISRRRPKV